MFLFINQFFTFLLIVIAIGFTLEKYRLKEYRNIPLRILMVFICIVSLFITHDSTCVYTDIIFKFCVCGIIINRWFDSVRSNKKNLDN